MLLLLLLLVASPAWAQFTGAGNVEKQSVEEQLAVAGVDDSVQVMLTRNRNVHPTGVILSQNKNFIQLQKERGSTQTFRRGLVYAVLPADTASTAHRQEVRLALRNRPDANQTRLLFAPTGRTHASGQVSLTNHELFFPYASLGIGGRLDVRVGASVMPNTVQFMYGGGKIGLVQGDAVNVAVGAIGTATTNVITVESGKDEYGGVVYALGTFGTPEKALTVGAGYLAAGGIIEEQGLAMVGGELRIKDSPVKLISENYLLYGSGREGEHSKQLFGGKSLSGDVNGIASLGARLIGDRTSMEVGVATSNAWWGRSLPVLPLVSFSYSMGGPL